MLLTPTHPRLVWKNKQICQNHCLYLHTFAVPVDETKAIY